jgi:aminoglycoside phosphotransferase (APT) family kinase protein
VFVNQHRVEFTESENPWAPTAVVAEINELTGSGLILTGLAGQTGGTSSAAFVRWPDGRDGALTRTKTPLREMRQTAQILNAARARGLPVPRHDLVAATSDGFVALVQERMPGEHLERMTPDVVDALVEMNERFAHLLADHPEVAGPAAFPTSELAEVAWSMTLGRYNDRSRRLLDRLRQIDGGRFHEMAGDDLVHADYNLGNVLFDADGIISGVVDWNWGAARGDRRFALLGLRWGSLGRGATGEEGAARLDEVLASWDPALLAVYEAHWLMSRLQAAIQNNLGAERIEEDLARAERYVSQLP